MINWINLKMLLKTKVEKCFVSDLCDLHYKLWFLVNLILVPRLTMSLDQFRRSM